jgi:ADP-heptose:LPS heptosyltransferase
MSERPRLDPDDLAREALAAAREGGNIAALDRLLTSALAEDPDVATAGTRALFAGVIEPLCDSFSRADRDAYARVMVRAIDAARRVPRGTAIDAALSSVGLRTEADLIARTGRVRTGHVVGDPADVRRVFVLSRVTLGADVAVTSVALRRLAERFPNARQIVAGGPKLAALYGGDARIEFARLDYPRRGGLADRLAGWLDARAFFDRAGFGARDLLIDPDTRVGQLGMLPLVDAEDRYHFFEGLADGPGDRRCLGEHFGEWLDARFGFGADVGGPFVALRPEDRATADAVNERSALRGRRVVAVSLGVGGNARKRIGEAFERELVAALLDADRAVVLDSGGDDTERAVARAVATAARAAGRRVAAFDERGGASPLPGSDDRPDLITWDGGVGPFAALIGRATAYAGYDSLFQHVAAAQGVPVAAVFVGYDSPLFPVRWRPCGPAPVRVFAFGPGEDVPADLAGRVAAAVTGE